MRKLESVQEKETHKVLWDFFDKNESPNLDLNAITSVDRKGKKNGFFSFQLTTE